MTTAPAKAVWSAPDTGWNRTNIWAPELHYAEGRWYIYYAGGRRGPPFTSQHAGVLQSASDDPFGPYTSRGMLYTGGIVFYLYDERVRHFHGIWHLCVLAGSALHYAALVQFVA